MKLIASIVTAALAFSVVGVASAEPRDVREHRVQPTREVRERPVKERTAVQREHRETREATSTRRGDSSSTVKQGKQRIWKICTTTPQECH